MNKPSIAIIGSGISGICAFIQIKKKLGIISTVYEMNENLGGVWFNNTYPGCRCDIPSHLYSFSFELNPNWSESFSTQKEILNYLIHVAGKYDMVRHTNFKTKVVSATWLQDLNKWQLELHNLNDDSIKIKYVDILFSAMGTLNVPNIPPLFERFKGGPVVHTARWNPSIDFKNKRVAIVGSGSSAIQTIPYLVENVLELTAYQRSAPWVFHQTILKYSNLHMKILSYFPVFQLIYRFLFYCIFELLFCIPKYPDSIVSKTASKFFYWDSKRKLIKLDREDWVDSVLPKYTLGCKRGAFSPNYYESIAKNHVTIVRDQIKDINHNIIETENGDKKQVDILILATGFKTNDGMLGDIKIFGKQGESLTDEWNRKLPRLFKSTTIHGFPNLFFLLGPYTYLGHNSLISMVETQVDYAIHCIQVLGRTEPKLESQEKYMNEIHSSYKGSAWLTSCSSWYKNKDGKITNLYPNTPTQFRWELSKFSKDDYI